MRDEDSAVVLGRSLRRQRWSAAISRPPANSKPGVAKKPVFDCLKVAASVVAHQHTAAVGSQQHMLRILGIDINVVDDHIPAGHPLDVLAPSSVLYKPSVVPA